MGVFRHPERSFAWPGSDVSVMFRVVVLCPIVVLMGKMAVGVFGCHLEVVLDVKPGEQI